RGNRDDHRQHRPPPPSGAHQPGHVPGWRHPADLLLPGNRRHPDLGRPPRVARSPDPGGGLTLDATVRPAPHPANTPPAAPAHGTGPTAAEDRVSLASNWTLVWWRFRKHRLAMVSAAVLLGLYTVVLVPDF